MTNPELTKSMVTKSEVTKSKVTKTEVTKSKVTKTEVTNPELTKSKGSYKNNNKKQIKNSKTEIKLIIKNK